jgi:hypothetical protein
MQFGGELFEISFSGAFEEDAIHDYLARRSARYSSSGRY